MLVEKKFLSKLKSVLSIYLLPQTALLVTALTTVSYISPAQATSSICMRSVPAGSYQFGSNEHFREEAPSRNVSISGFKIGCTEVTNREFASFVTATGYVTTAERPLDPADYPGMPAELLQAGSMVFAQPTTPPDNPDDFTQWWRYVPGANWQHPTGPDSSIATVQDHPVVQVSYEDAQAYAEWSKLRLPTEAEWEYAARGGLTGEHDWQRSFDLKQGWKANTWQGVFPAADLTLDRHHGTAPVASYAANGYNLYDMIGNVWEMVAGWYTPGHIDNTENNPAGAAKSQAARYSNPTVGPTVVIKGGSWLCAPNYCARYRPSARQSQELSLGSNHVGFRVAADDATPK